MICMLRLLLAIAVFRLIIIIIRLFDLIRFCYDFCDWCVFNNWYKSLG